MKKNKKGFTLVEIIISIAIGSIVLMIAGSMFVSSFKFLFSTTDTDLDKRAVDSLIDVVRSDVEHSYDVRLVKADSDMAKELTTENGWHSYYVKENVLYRDNEKLLDNSYYNKKNFELYANGNYENGVRVDFKYVLKNNDETAYSARDTIMFLNVTTAKEILDVGLYKDGYVPLTGEIDGYRLYFSDKYKAPNMPNNTGDGTIESIQNYITSYNYRGVYNPNHSYQYQKGEIVWHNGYWWERLAYSDKREPGTSFGWKRLTKEYCQKNLDAPNNMYSSYEKGDIVIYNNYYYEAIQDVIENDGSQYYGFITDTSRWKKIGSINDSSAINYVNQHTYEKRQIYTNSVVEKYLPLNIDLRDISKENFQIFDSNKNYTDGDIVKMQNSVDPHFYDLWIKKACFNVNKAPGTPDSGWVKIDVSWDSGSSYVQGDIVRYVDGQNLWIEALTNVIEVNNPREEIYTYHRLWKISN